nr:pupal cuticle protein 27-like [Lepeophtheirus salmonis]
MNTFVLCSVLLSYALLIDAGLVRVRRDDPLTNYDDVFVGQASGLNPVSTQFDGSSGSFSGSSSFGGSISHTSPIRQEAIISETNNPPGTLGDNSDFSYAFETENGIKQQVVGSTIDVGGKSVVVMKGSYEYIGDDGQIYVVDWIADENGFQPSGPHIPKEIIDAVQAQIVFASDGGSSFNSGSSSGSSFSGSGNGFQGQFNGFEGQFDEFEGQLDGFEGQFDEFEGQLNGFEGQSSRLNSIGAASRNFPVNTSPILPSYPS